MLVEFILGIAGNILASAGERGFQEFITKTPIKKAITATAKEFPENNLVKGALTRWSQSDEFLRQVESVRLQQISITEQDEVDLFVNVGQFHDGILGTHNKALEVLRAFKTNLEREFYLSPDGLYLESKRADSRHSENQANYRNVKGHLEQLATKSDLQNLLRAEPRIFITESESITKSQYDLNFRNNHQLKFIKRENRNIEIELKKAKPVEEKNVLRISFIFSFSVNPGFYGQPKDLLKSLIRERTLKENYGADWITYNELSLKKWTIHGQILTKEFPKLSYLAWLDRDFIVHPEYSFFTETGEPSNSSKISFTLIESDDTDKIVFKVENQRDIELITALLKNSDSDIEANPLLQIIHSSRCPIHNKGIGLRTIFIDKIKKQYVIESCCQDHINSALEVIRNS